MKVLHVIESNGGTIEFIFLLGKYSPEIQHHVFCGKRAWDDLNRIKENNPENFPLNITFSFWAHAQREVRPIKDLLSLFKLIHFFKIHYDYHVIHLHSSKAGFIGRIAAWWLKKKNIIYTTQAISFIRQDISQFTKNLYIFLEKLGYKLGGLVVCSSDSEKRALIEIGINAISIPNGTEQILKFDKVPFDKSIKIITSGRITAQKNPQLFQKIAENYINDPSVTFIWAGDGELRSTLTSSNIEITGWLTREEVRRQVSNGDIYISTALWEGMPYSVLEAMALSKPLVLNNCIGNVDLVDYNNGYIFNNMDEAISFLNILLENNEKRFQMGISSHSSFLDTYEIRKIVPQFLNIYDSVKDEIA